MLPPAEARRHHQRGCPGAEAGGGRGGGAGRVHEGQQGLVIVPPGGEMFTLAQGCSHVSPVLTTPQATTLTLIALFPASIN